MLIDRHNHHQLRLPNLRRFLQRAHAQVRIAGDYTVCLASDAEVRSLNARYRGVDAPTDVLSFGSEEDEPGGGGAYLGDIVVSVDTAARQAAALGHSVEQEVCVLMLHGLLHLAGYDHVSDNGEMRAREDELRRALDLPSALISRTHAAQDSIARGRTAKTASKRRHPAKRRTG